MMNGDTNYLKLIRFCGEELFPVEVATWNIFAGNNGFNTLSLEVFAGKPLKQCEDTFDHPTEPKWEIMCDIKGLTGDMLEIGFKVQVSDKEDEDRNLFYYYEHEVSTNHFIEVLDRKGDDLLIRITAETRDVNFYDGSRPETKLIIETWFEKFDRNNKNHLR